MGLPGACKRYKPVQLAEHASWWLVEVQAVGEAACYHKGRSERWQGAVLATAPDLDGKMRFGAIIERVGCEYRQGRALSSCAGKVVLE